MKRIPLALLILLSLSMAVAGPRNHRVFRRHSRAVVVRNTWKAPKVPYYHRYDWPVAFVVHERNDESVKVQNVSVDDVKPLLVIVKDIKHQGILTAKESRKAKNEILNKVGKTVKWDSGTVYANEILKQIRTLSELYENNTIKTDDFQSQKRKLLQLL